MANIREKYLTPEKSGKKYLNMKNDTGKTAPTTEPRGQLRKGYNRQFHDGHVSVSLTHGRPDYSPDRLETQEEKEIAYSSRHHRFNGMAYSFSKQKYRQDRKLANLHQQNLHEIIATYEKQIHALMTYINESQILERERIISIIERDYNVGLQLQCNCNIDEAKLILRELSEKVNSLVNENNMLKSHEKSRKKNFDSVEDSLLLSQNKKLRSIIQNYRRQESTFPENSRQTHQLHRELNQLKQENKTLHIVINNLKQSQKLPQPSVHSSISLEAIKQELSSLIYGCTQNLERNLKSLEERVQSKDQQINYIEKLIVDYQKQRNLRIDSTIRKSYILSQSLKRPEGDSDFEKSIRDEEMEKDIQQSSFKKFSSSLIKEEGSLPSRPQSLGIASNANEIKFLNDRNLMLEMRNKNVVDENQELRRILKQKQAVISHKISRILLLQGQIQHLKGLVDRIEENYTPQSGHEIRRIRKILQDCNITNYESFFQEMNEIIKQRDLMKSKINEYQAISSKINQQRKSSGTFSPPKSQNILQKKIAQLVEENKQLVSKIAEMELKMETYYQELMNSEIQKLSEISFINQSMMSNGKEALDWQRIVKQSIQESIYRLEKLERKVRVQDKKLHSNESTHRQNKEIEAELIPESSPAQVKSILGLK